jgi:hypothetical protein
MHYAWLHVVHMHGQGSAFDRSLAAVAHPLPLQWAGRRVCLAESSCHSSTVPAKDKVAHFNGRQQLSLVRPSPLRWAGRRVCLTASSCRSSAAFVSGHFITDWAVSSSSPTKTPPPLVAVNAVCVAVCLPTTLEVVCLTTTFEKLSCSHGNGLNIVTTCWLIF